VFSGGAKRARPRRGRGDRQTTGSISLARPRWSMVDRGGPVLLLGDGSTAARRETSRADDVSRFFGWLARREREVVRPNRPAEPRTSVRSRGPAPPTGDKRKSRLRNRVFPCPETAPRDRRSSSSVRPIEGSSALSVAPVARSPSRDPQSSCRRDRPRCSSEGRGSTPAAVVDEQGGGSFCAFPRGSNGRTCWRAPRGRRMWVSGLREESSRLSLGAPVQRQR